MFSFIFHIIFVYLQIKSKNENIIYYQIVRHEGWRRTPDERQNELYG